MLNKSVPHMIVREGGSMVVRLSGKMSGWVNEPVRCEGTKMIGCELEVGGASCDGELSLLAQQKRSTPEPCPFPHLARIGSYSRYHPSPCTSKQHFLTCW